MNPRIIFEDDIILVIDKPSGWITNSASTTTNQPVVQNWLAENLKSPARPCLAGPFRHEASRQAAGGQISNFKLYRSGIVHRLDKETSGILLVAKTTEAFENLQKQFKERRVKKEYSALVHGQVVPEKGRIEASVGRLPWRRERFGVLAGGRKATTGYKVIRYYDSKGENFSFMEIYPKTGRTHQIRIHLKYIGHTVVADEFYAGRKTARKDRKWCPRLFLHASKIEFFHPKTDKKTEFSSKLPADLKKALKSLTRTP